MTRYACLHIAYVLVLAALLMNDGRTSAFSHSRGGGRGRKNAFPLRRADAAEVDDVALLERIDWFLDLSPSERGGAQVCQGCGPEEVVQTFIDALGDLHEPVPYQGAATAQALSVPLTMAEKARPDVINIWRRLLRAAMTPQQLSQLIACSPLRVLLDWEGSRVVRRHTPAETAPAAASLSGEAPPLTAGVVTPEHQWKLAATEVELDLVVYESNTISDTCIVFRLWRASSSSPWLVHSIVRADTAVLKEGEVGVTALPRPCPSAAAVSAEGLTEREEGGLSLGDGLRRYMDIRRRAETPPKTFEDYSQLTRLELKEILRSRRLLVSGRKAELVQRLVDDDNDDDDDEGSGGGGGGGGGGGKEGSAAE